MVRIHSRRPIRWGKTRGSGDWAPSSFTSGRAIDAQAPLHDPDKIVKLRAVLTVALLTAACGDNFSGAPGLFTGGSGGASATTSTTSTTSDGVGGASSTNTMSTATGGKACAACAPPVPNGWSGPALRISGDEAANGCPGPVIDQGYNVAAPSAQCTCTCLPACSKPTAKQYGVNAGCGGVATKTIELGYGCSDATIDFMLGGSFAVTTSTIGMCPARTSKDVGPVVLGVLVALCTQTPTEGSCDAGTCMDAYPLGESAALCIYQPGVVDCPEAYPLREQLAHKLEDVTDTRSCAACSCGPRGPGGCKGKASGYLGKTCGGAGLGEAPIDGSCNTSLGGTLQSVKTTLQGPTCEPAGGEPTGSADVSATGFTVCCAK